MSDSIEWIDLQNHWQDHGIQNMFHEVGYSSFTIIRTFVLFYCRGPLIHHWNRYCWPCYKKVIGKRETSNTPCTLLINFTFNYKITHRWHKQAIDQSHKSHNALDKHPKIHHVVTEIGTHVHISVTQWCTVECGKDAFWDFCMSQLISKYESFNRY